MEGQDGPTYLIPLTLPEPPTFDEEGVTLDWTTPIWSAVTAAEGVIFLGAETTKEEDET